MPNSVYQSRTGTVWPLGYIAVPTPGTPVCIMHNVDASNNNAPGTASNSSTSEYATVVRALAIQGYHPGANNNGMVANVGNIYLMMRPVGSGTGNRSDTGAMLKVIPPGQDLFFPIDPTGQSAHDPYSYFLDGDNSTEGALVTAYSGLNP